eukprot:2098394-Heterocapsa_arctica.AAC.1
MVDPVLGEGRQAVGPGRKRGAGRVLRPQDDRPWVQKRALSPAGTIAIPDDHRELPQKYATDRDRISISHLRSQ